MALEPNDHIVKIVLSYLDETPPKWDLRDMTYYASQANPLAMAALRVMATAEREGITLLAAITVETIALFSAGQTDIYHGLLKLKDELLKRDPALAIKFQRQFAAT